MIWNFIFFSLELWLRLKFHLDNTASIFPSEIYCYQGQSICIFHIFCTFLKPSTFLWFSFSPAKSIQKTQLCRRPGVYFIPSLWNGCHLKPSSERVVNERKFPPCVDPLFCLATNGGHMRWVVMIHPFRPIFNLNSDKWKPSVVCLTAQQSTAFLKPVFSNWIWKCGVNFYTSQS